MSHSTTLVPQPSSPPARPAALPALPRQQASWIAAQTAAAGGLGLAGVWMAEPNLALSLALGAGVAVINPRRLWAAPLVLALVVGGGLLAEAIRIPAVLGAGATAGFLAAWLLPQGAGWIDHLHGALATAAAAALGLWAATGLLPGGVGTVLGATLTAALTGLVAAQGLVPLALRFDAVDLPTRRQIRRTLRRAYRAPVEKAVALYRESTARQAPDAQTRRGLAEVALWVFRLQVTLQTLDQELAAIDPAEVTQRIARCEGADEADSFTRERRQATADHLRRLLEHREGLGVERTRTIAVVDYALAFLEEARAGLALGRRLPGEARPDRLPEVLHRLRSHAAEGDARRRTQREMQHLEA